MKKAVWKKDRTIESTTAYFSLIGRVDRTREGKWEVIRPRAIQFENVLFKTAKEAKQAVEEYHAKKVIEDERRKSLS